MAKSTIIIVGPSGIGKSPLDKLIRPDVIRLDPYRLRKDGPRDNEDRLYAPPKLRLEMSAVFREFGEQPMEEEVDGEKVEWYPKAHVAFFTVRSEWQCIIVPRDAGALAKMEIYAPILPTLLKFYDFNTSLGKLKGIFLNPASESILYMKDWEAIKVKTRQNCLKRGDSKESTEKRVESVASEAPHWRKLVENRVAIEEFNWPFAEHRYKREPNLLEKVKDYLLERHSKLNKFFVEN